MAALAQDLRAEIPDLADQFRESRLNQRRNSGFGLFTEMIIDRDRPVPSFGPSGDLGTVHAMVGALPDPIAFKARVRNGVLLGLLGDSYGQDTRAIDFAVAPFDQVFTVSVTGESVPFDAGRYTSQSPRLNPDRSPVPPNPMRSQPAQKMPGAPRQVQGAPRAPDIRAEPAQPADPASVDQMTLLIGLWALTGVVALILVFVFRLPFAFGIFFAILAGRAVKDPKFLARVRRLVDGWAAASATGKG